MHNQINNGKICRKKTIFVNRMISQNKRLFFRLWGELTLREKAEFNRTWSGSPGSKSLLAAIIEAEKDGLARLPSQVNDGSARVWLRELTLELELLLTNRSLSQTPFEPELHLLKSLATSKDPTLFPRYYNRFLKRLQAQASRDRDYCWAMEEFIIIQSEYHFFNNIQAPDRTVEIHKYYWIRMQIESIRMIYVQKENQGDLFFKGIEKHIDVERLAHPDILSEFPLLRLYFAFYDAIKNQRPNHQRLAQLFIDYRDQIEPSYQKNFYGLILNFLIRATWTESHPDLYPAIAVCIQDSFDQGYGKIGETINYRLLTLLVRSYYFQQKIQKGNLAWEKYLPSVPIETRNKTQSYLELLQAYFLQDWESFDHAWDHIKLKQYAIIRRLDCQFMAAQTYLSRANISKFDNQLRRIRSTLATATFKFEIYKQIFQIRLKRLRELSRITPDQVNDFLKKLKETPLPYGHNAFLETYAKSLK